MKLTSSFVAVDLETGDFTDAFGSELFDSPASIVQKVADAERRVSIAQAKNELASQFDIDMLDSVRDKSFMIINVVNFNL